MAGGKFKAKAKAKAESFAKLYPCDICEYTSSRRHNMEVHMDIKHPEGRTLKWICDICGESHPIKRSLERHIKANHKELNPVQGTITLENLEDNINLKRVMSHDYIKDLTIGAWTKSWVSNRFTNCQEPNYGQKLKPWAPSKMGEQSRGRPPGQNCGNGSRQVGGMLEGRENPHQV